MLWVAMCLVEMSQDMKLNQLCDPWNGNCISHSHLLAACGGPQPACFFWVLCGGKKLHTKCMRACMHTCR